MQDNELTIAALGEEPPLSGDGRNGPPDKREVSARWLTGTFLTGVTSTILMGVALSAALDGREQLATPPEIANLASLNDEIAGEAAKAARLIPPRTIASAKDQRRMEVSTVIKQGDRDVIRTMPFVQVKMALAAGHKTSRSYPAFDPLVVFAEDGAAAQTATTGLIYGAKVESEVSLKVVDFPLDTATFDEQSGLTADKVEEVVRSTASILTDGDVQVASLHYVDPQRFGETFATQALAPYGVKIVQENVSVAPRDPRGEPIVEYAEDFIPFPTDRKIGDAFAESGYEGEDGMGMAQSIAKLLNTEKLKAGNIIRLGIETIGEESHVMRCSVYNGKQHVLTIAVDDRGQYVMADEPQINPELLTAFGEKAPVRVRGDLPTVYDGVYRAAYSYGLTDGMTKQLAKLLASEVDYQSRLNPADKLEVFFSNPDAEDKATAESELLYVKASFGGNMRTYYRFQMSDGAVDYFDSDGKSARQFLLRNPVPNGKFRSGFGMRRHPILGYSRMHTGVDWSAPRGTPIIASGNGVVEKAGWSGGYGRQTIIRHTNGYETSYNHQSAFAKGIVPGARVRQGQVIGYVGATGLATGDHLHYELMVNGSKVDPMRVRLPVSRVLKGDDLEAFARERDRIDILLHDESEPALKVAASG